MASTTQGAIYDPQYGWVWPNPDGTGSSRRVVGNVVYDDVNGRWVTLNQDGSTGVATQQQIADQKKANAAGWGASDAYNENFVENAGPGMAAQGRPVPSSGIVGMPTGGVQPTYEVYRDSPEEAAYQQWVMQQGTQLANRDDNRYSIGTSGLTAAPSTAGYVDLGSAAQAAGYNLGTAPQVGMQDLGRAPTVNRVDLGAAAQMAAAQLGSAAQAGRVDMGTAAQIQAAQLGQAAQSNRVDMGQAQMADLYATDFNGAFDPSLQAYGDASSLNQYATNIDGSYIQDAAEIQRLAALGYSPSEAEAMAMQAGVDTQLRLDQAANQSGYLSNVAAEAIAKQQLSQAAAQRGGAAGLAGLNAMNQTALAQAQLYQGNQQNLAQNNLQYIAAGQTAQNQAAQVRAQEMAAARAAYGDLGSTIRSGDFQGAQNAYNIAQGYQGIDQSLLGAAQQNTEFANQNSQYNVGAYNDRMSQQGQLDAQNNQYNANLWQQQAFQQGQMNQQASLANQDAYNTMRQQQGQMDLNNNQYNANLQQQQAFQQGTFTQQANQSNQAAINARRDTQGQMDLNTNQYNASNLQNQQFQQSQLNQAAAIRNAELAQQQSFTQGNLTTQNNQYNANLRQQQALNQGNLTQSTNQFNAGQTNQVVQQNLGRVTGVLQGNQQIAAATGAGDDAIWGQTASFGQAAYENDRANQIRGQEALWDYASHDADREANRQVGAATNSLQRAQIQQQQTGAIVGAGAALIGGLIAGAPGAAAGGAAGQAVANPNSDKKNKKIIGDEDVADFTRAYDKRYTYKPGIDDEEGEHIGPMADELPDDVIRYKPNGDKLVNTARLALRAASATGDLQRRVKELEARK